MLVPLHRYIEIRKVIEIPLNPAIVTLISILGRISFSL